jgi:hypothetical protein
MMNGPISNKEWARSARSHLHYGGWNVEVFGPVPGQCGCRCPQDILKQIGHPAAEAVPKPPPPADDQWLRGRGHDDNTDC